MLVTDCFIDAVLKTIEDVIKNLANESQNNECDRPPSPSIEELEEYAMSILMDSEVIYDPDPLDLDDLIVDPTPSTSTSKSKTTAKSRSRKKKVVNDEDPLDFDDAITSTSTSKSKKTAMSKPRKKKVNDDEVIKVAVKSNKASPTAKKRIRSPSKHSAKKRSRAKPNKSSTGGQGTKQKRQYLRHSRVPVDEFNKGNKETEFGLKFQNYFSYLYLVAMKDYSVVLDYFQMSIGWNFATFQKSAQLSKINHIFHV